MNNSIPPCKTSPLLRRMRDAINKRAPFHGKLRVSVADEPKWEKSKSGDEVLVRWACWNLEEGGHDVTQPEFEVLSKDITREKLASELPALFPDLDVVIDNEIDV
jgi:hypothetical protein